MTHLVVHVVVLNVQDVVIPTVMGISRSLNTLQMMSMVDGWHRMSRWIFVRGFIPPDGVN